MTALFIKFLSVLTAVVMAINANLPLIPKKDDDTEYEQCKNVIFMIGDGMGFNSIAKTKAEDGIETLNMDTFPLQGESKTSSASSIVTDSAAGGSALACGVRIINNTVGVYSYDVTGLISHPMSLSELAISQGKLAGVITTDSTSGATPADFSTHTSNRSNEKDISSQQLASELTLVWGTKTKSISAEAAEENGFEFIYDKATMDALEEGTRSFGQFDSELWHESRTEGMPVLSEMTEKAIDLLDDDDDGFFLMVEGAHIDKNSHNKNGEGMKDALKSFDKAVGVALDYAKEHGDTLVIVTADHETGAIKLKNGVYKYTSGNHSAANVPLLVYGCENFMEKGEIMKNCEASQKVAHVMGCEEFPIKQYGIVPGKVL